MTAFRDRGFEISGFRDVASVRAGLRLQDFDGIVLEDVEHEVGHWLAALQLSAGSRAPLVVFGAGGVNSMVRALRSGADEYATHADGPAALMQRLEARLQVRRESACSRRLQAGPCSLDAASRCIRSRGCEIALTSREYALAATLFENLGRVVAYHMLSNEIWGRQSDIAKRTIEQHVYRLRRKIKDVVDNDDVKPVIQAVYGVGYRLQTGERDAEHPTQRAAVLTFAV